MNAVELLRAEAGSARSGTGDSVPSNAEIWEASVGSLIDRFGVGYQDLANLYLDTNGGHYYSLDTSVAEGTVGVGSAVISPNVLGVTWGVDAAGNLAVDVLVKNIAFEKQVAIVYTANGWLTLQNAFGNCSQSLAPASSPHQPNAELWEIVADVRRGSPAAARQCARDQTMTARMVNFHPCDPRKRLTNSKREEPP
jgi:hypothetical protein